MKKTTSASWLAVGITVTILLFAIAYGLHKRQEYEQENRTFQSRMINKVQEVRDVKNAVKKLVK